MENENDTVVCLLDVLGFENLFNKYGLEAIEAKYRELIEIVEEQNIEVAFTVSPDGHPMFGSPNIKSAYFSDTIIFWCKYDVFRLEVLMGCMKELVCKSIEIGMPLRGAISVGKVMIDKEHGIFLGHPIISAARAEVAQKWIGITLSKTFDYKPYSHGFKADMILKYDKHLRDGHNNKVIPLVVDYPRHWRLKRHTLLIDEIQKLNVDSIYSEYYDNTVAFAKYSEDNHDWWLKHPEYQKELERRKQQERLSSSMNSEIE